VTGHGAFESSGSRGPPERDDRSGARHAPELKLCAHENRTLPHAPDSRAFGRDLGVEAAAGVRDLELDAVPAAA
jgi:hypothetical protein